MSGSLINDDAMKAARASLDGLSMRQQVISRNLANVDTPGYKAQSVNFEDILQRVFKRSTRIWLDRTNTSHLASPTQRLGSTMLSDRPGGSVRADQNNVDLDVELTEMTETGIRYQAVSQSVSKKLQLLKTIANSR